MIWLHRTTGNSTYFVQSLGIRCNDSRLYVILSFSFKDWLYDDKLKANIEMR